VRNARRSPTSCKGAGRNAVELRGVADVELSEQPNAFSCKGADATQVELRGVESVESSEQAERSRSST
jgi:hypothetical protein